MRMSELEGSLASSGLEAVTFGDAEKRLFIVPELHGRIFVALEGKVFHNVNPQAFRPSKAGSEFLNPGGDSLWCAPEGTRWGFFYDAGRWRVPEALAKCQYKIVRIEKDRLTIRSSFSLRNALGIEIPLESTRVIRQLAHSKGVGYETRDTLRYLGEKPLSYEDARVVPWTLSQYPASGTTRAFFPFPSGARLKDFYEPFGDRLKMLGESVELDTDGRKKGQIGISPEVPMISFRDSASGLVVTRKSQKFLRTRRYIDIADRPPTEDYNADFPTRYSIYNGDNSILELESCGAMSAILEPGVKITLVTENEHYFER